MYKAREQKEILQELQDWSKSPLATFEGTFEYDVLSSNSMEFEKFEVELEKMYLAAFADTSYGDFLTMITGGAGVIRRQATCAIGTLTVTGNGTIQAGMIFSTIAGIRFEALEETVVVDTADISVQCAATGSQGNVPAGAVINIPMSIPGIISVTNAEATHDGYDMEEDEDLRERYYFKVRKPVTSGNPWHYVQWAMEVEGVGTAKVQRAWAGPNTVKVIIVDSNMQEASDTLCRKVWEHIEGERPVGARVTVVSAVAVPIDIEAQVEGSMDEAAFREAVMEYFKALDHLVMQTEIPIRVSFARIGSLILTAGLAEDYDRDSLLLNGQSRNVTLSIEEMPVIGEVTFHAASG